MAFSPDGKLLASTSANNTVKLWDIPSEALLQTFKGPKRSTWAAALALVGKLYKEAL
jgi:WD40 repeat protein